MWLSVVIFVFGVLALGSVLRSRATDRTKTAKQRLEIAQMKLAITPDDQKRRAECEKLLAEYEKCLSAQNPKLHRSRPTRRKKSEAEMYRDNVPLKWFHGEERKIERQRRIEEKQQGEKAEKE